MKTTITDIIKDKRINRIRYKRAFCGAAIAPPGGDK